MTVVNVILDSGDHYCCGRHREVGDVVTIEVLNYEGMIYEQRHGGLDLVTQPITGTVTGIQWRPAILRRKGEYAMVLEGYGAGHPVDTTDYQAPDVESWAFDFTLDTDDPIPPPRTTHLGRPGTVAADPGSVEEWLGHR